MKRDARIAYVTKAMDVATDHNLLPGNDRHEFQACITDGRLDEAESWALLVIYDLADRCKSFTPPALVILDRMARDAGAIQ